MTSSFTGRRAFSPGIGRGGAWKRRRVGWRLLWQDVAARASAYADRESQRFFVFLPVLLIAGILLGEASRVGAAAAGALTASLLLLRWVLQRRGLLRAAYGTGAVGAVAAGMLLFAFRVEMVRAPVLRAELPPSEVSGRLLSVELRERDRRYTLAVDSIEGLRTDELPRKVRISWRGKPGSEAPGDVVRMRAVLAPPPGPALPGGYDFSRQMFFEGIGGAGYAFTPPLIEAQGGGGFMLAAERLRESIADHVEGRIGGREGAVAAALMTGKRERIPEESVNALRDAGLAHLLAISGLHMGLVCGFIFFAARWLLSRSEHLTLHWPIKKIAAATALAAGLFYLMLSGGAWSAQRAFIMAAVSCVAILLDQRAVSLRNAAAAAVIILVLRPEAVFSPGFQMSFAAVVTLIAAFAYLEERFPRNGERGRFGKAASFIGGLTMTSLLAGFATGPFAAYHFGRIASFGLLGNMLAMPIVTLAVMPMLVLSLFLIPIGLDGPALWLVGKGIGLVLMIAEWTSSLPGAVKTVPQMSVATILLASLGLMALALPKSPWRVLGLPLLLLALPAGLASKTPEVFVSRNLRNVGVVEEEGRTLTLLSKRRDRFSSEAWLQALGVAPDVKAQASFENCGPVRCVAALPGGGDLHVVMDRAGLSLSCRSAAVVLLQAEGTKDDAEACEALLLSRDEGGAHPPVSIARTKSGLRVRTAKGYGFTANSM
jgi:competence protein ComEC